MPRTDRVRLRTRLLGGVVSVLVLMQGASAQAPTQPELLVQTGASSLTTIGPVATSPDGRWYAVTSPDGMQLWSVDLKSQIGHIPIYGQTARLFAIAADAKTLLCAGEFTHVGSQIVTEFTRINAVTGKQERQEHLPLLISSLAASPTEMVFATMDGSDNQIEVFSATDGTSLFHDTAAHHPPSTIGITMSHTFFSPDGRLVFLANPERLVGWDWRAGKRVLDLDMHNFDSSDLSREVAVNYSNGQTRSTAAAEFYNLLQSVDIARDGRALVACTKDELTLFSIDPATEAFMPQPKLPSPEGRLFAQCGFFPGQRYFATTYPTGNPIQQRTALYASLTAQPVNIRGVVDAILPIPHRSLSLARVQSQPPLLLSDDGAIANQPSPPAQLAILPAFAPALRKLWWGEATPHPLIWDMSSGEATRLASVNAASALRAVSSDGQRLAFDDPNAPAFTDQLDVADAATGKLLAHFDAYAQYLSFEPVFDAAASRIAFIGADGKLRVGQVADASILFTLALTPDELNAVHASLSPDSALLCVALPTHVSVYALPSGKRVADFPDKNPAPLQASPQFSPDGAWLAVARFGEPLRLIATRDWKTTKSLSTIVGDHTVFSADGKRVAYWAGVSVDPAENKPGEDFSGGALVVDDIALGKHMYSVPGVFARAAFTPDGSFLLAQSSAGALLLDAASGKLLATLYVFGGEAFDDWLVVTPDGLFDGSPGAWARVSWRMNKTSFDIAPVELFFREFFHPALLADLFAGQHPTAPANLAALDRRQPSVSFHAEAPVQDAATPSVHLRLIVTESRAAAQGQPAGSGARDLRLFRNGTLVKVWRGTLHLNARGEAEFAVDVPIVAGENRFTAYAFNTANIKSNDASLLVTGAASLARKGTAYVLAIGINRYAHDTPTQRMNLNFAEADAAEFAASFSRSQQALDTFSQVRTVQLSSADATRDNILAALQVLSGKPKSTLTAAQKTLFDPLDNVRPEDGVFLFYAGHGAASAGHFYLLPHDYDPQSPPSNPAAHAISEEDLSVALEAISPARTFLVIDACQSGKALDTAGAVGPMNSTGLAQLAYEKGLYILAASQGFESALEAPQLAGGHGYLTYALIEDGLKHEGAAVHGVVELRPWFEFASHRVPDLQTGLLTDSHPGGRGLTIVDETTGKEAPNVRVRQHPRVFYRREPETSPFVVQKRSEP